VEEKEKKAQIDSLAKEIIKLSRDQIAVNMRFLEMALYRLKPKSVTGFGRIATDRKNILYDPVYVLECYKKEQTAITRVYLHLLFHCVFFHSFQYDKLKKEYWDLACDLAVEHMILDLGIANTAMENDDAQRQILTDYKKEAGKLTAERLYKNFLVNEPSQKRMGEIKRLFSRDNHESWLMKEEELAVSLAEWKKISERIKTDLKSFSKGKNKSNALSENLREVTRENYDYGSFLRRFMTMGEQMKVNDEEFDYIYYTYGLELYYDMPLVEPLEYADDKKIKEFVIAIDTSASCRGKTVQAFLKKTYSIMKSSETFFRKMNVHILQCDNCVESDTVIHSQEEFDEYIKNGKLVGFGTTDFRPAFEYVKELQEKGEFKNLKGLIYFTDGYGTYPEKAPEYDVAFVFVRQNGPVVSDNVNGVLLNEGISPDVPPWAIRLILDSEEFEGE